LQAYGVHAVRYNRTNAIAYIEKAIELETANPISHALLANLNLDQPELALQSLEIALGLWPNEPDWHALAAHLSDQLGNTELAEKHIQSALEAQPENAAYWQTSAKLKADNNDLYQAKLDLEKSTFYQPDDPSAWSKMAQVNRRMGAVSEALDNIRKAQELDPGDQNLDEIELNLLYDQKNFTDLEVKAKETISKNHSNETALIFLAKALAKQGKFDQALSTLHETAQKHPDKAHLTLEYLMIKKEQNGTEAVLPELVALAKNHPQDPQTLSALTDWLIQTNRLDQAEDVAQTTLRIIPDQAEIYLMLGRLQRMRGKLDQAIAHLSQAIALEPNLIDAYIELGKTYQERRELDKAVEIYEKGSQSVPSDPRPYYYAGLALKDIKDYPGAEMMFKQAKKYSPDDANIIRQLGVVTALNLINNLREAS
jgi:tetratricopeptide (TPR) repeat protein